MKKLLVTNEEYKRSEAYLKSVKYDQYRHWPRSPERFGPIYDWETDKDDVVQKVIDTWCASVGQDIADKQAEEKKKYKPLLGRDIPIRESINSAIYELIHKKAVKLTIWQRIIQLFGNRN